MALKYYRSKEGYPDWGIKKGSITTLTAGQLEVAGDAFEEVSFEEVQKAQSKQKKTKGKGK